MIRINNFIRIPRQHWDEEKKNSLHSDRLMNFKLIVCMEWESSMNAELIGHEKV